MLLQRYLEDAAARTPDAVALVTAERSLSYRELDGEANAVARGLVAAGVIPGDRVAIQLDNRAETVVAIFATLKAGAAFLMVNPSAKAQKVEYPAETFRGTRVRGAGVARGAAGRDTG